jgi:hypothetical protein
MIFENFEINGKKITIYISHDEINALLSSYDPDDFNSPDIVTCRALARLILDALKSAE